MDCRNFVWKNARLASLKLCFYLGQGLEFQTCRLRPLCFEKKACGWECFLITRGSERWFLNECTLPINQLCTMIWFLKTERLEWMYSSIKPIMYHSFVKSFLRTKGLDWIFLLGSLPITNHAPFLYLSWTLEDQNECTLP